MTTEILTKTEINCETGEVTVTPLNADEIAELEERKAAAQAAQEARDLEIARVNTLKASAKAKLVAGEPLTEDEAAVLVI